MYNIGYQRDIYKCTACNDWIAAGDIYCKHCGHKFIDDDVKSMMKESTFKSRWNAPIHGRFDELHKCKVCSTFIALSYKYCKTCGYAFTEDDMERMKHHGIMSHIKSAKYGVIVFSLLIIFMITLISLIK